MIISKTPLRVSLVGGSSDIPYYYINYGPGIVLSLTIDKYIYVIVKPRYDDLIHLGYTKVEHVSHVDHLEHDIIRHALEMTGIEYGVEIHTIADIPSTGSGLGSSSALAVGALNALYAHRSGSNAYPGMRRLADDACELEICRMDCDIGKQDQYACAYGGINTITFQWGSSGRYMETIMPEPLYTTDYGIDVLNRNLLLFHTGIPRSTQDIISTYSSEEAIDRNKDTIYKMVGQVNPMRAAIEGHDFDDIGPILHKAWEWKKELSDSITNPDIDYMYETAREAGATGGKLCGSGGGGHLLLYCPEGTQELVRSALSEYRELRFNIDLSGTRIMFNDS